MTFTQKNVPSLGVLMLVLVLAIQSTLGLAPQEKNFKAVHIIQKTWDDNATTVAGIISTEIQCAWKCHEEIVPDCNAYRHEGVKCEVAFLEEGKLFTANVNTFGVRIMLEGHLKPQPHVAIYYSQSGSTAVDDFLPLSPSQEEFTFPPVLNFPNGIPGMIFINHEIVMCGGQDIDMAQSSRLCSSYDAGANQFVTRTQMKVARRLMVLVAVLREFWWATGGYNANGALSSTEIFKGNTWSDGPDLPQNILQHCLVALNGGQTKFLLFGGKGNGGLVRKSWLYDFVNPEKGWVQKGNMAVRRFVAAYGLIKWTNGQNRVIVASGVDLANDNKFAEVFDEGTGQWTQLSGPGMEMPMPENIRSRHAVFQGDLYLFGGLEDKKMIRKFSAQSGWETLATRLPVGSVTMVLAFNI